MTDKTDTNDQSTTPAKRGGRARRLGLMLALPLAIAAGGGYVWATGGRYISTENAYVQQDKVSIAAEVAGRVVEVGVAENKTVAAGDLLFRIDPEPFQVALRAADAALASARLKVEQMRAAYEEALADQTRAEQTVEFRQREFERQQQLSKGGYAAEARLDEARNALVQAQQDAAMARQGVLSALAALGGDAGIETDRHPLVLEAVSSRDKAALDLAHTEIRAPAAGIISQTDRLQNGQYVVTGTPVVSLVRTGNIWIEANFKETDLTHLVAGQAATVELDVYPGRELHGQVESIGAGTGSEFAILPAQNATGNWVKVVQRVPVRVRLEDLPEGMALRSGLSAEVTVDTEHLRSLPGPVATALAAVGAR